MYRKINRARFIMNKRLLIFLISCFFLSEILINSSNDSGSRFQLAATTDFDLQTMQREGRRLLGKPGSFPPRCTSKCGRCTPCQPVHVSVPPGTPVTAEYYPEAWRCKCGDRFYMP